MKFDRRKFLVGTSAAAAALAAPGIIGRAEAADTIKMVGILDQSGGLDIYGKPMVDATKLAVEEINGAGGLLGKQIELVMYDPQSTIQFYTQYATQAAVERQGGRRPCRHHIGLARSHPPDAWAVQDALFLQHAL